MLHKRLIVCLDVDNKQVTKGVKFKGNEALGCPVLMAHKYMQEGVDELVFYDITASSQNRSLDFDMVSKVAEKVFIPFTVGGGIRSLDDMKHALWAGAEKVSLNSLAVSKPSLITEGAEQFGSQCVVLGMDVKYVGKRNSFPSGYQIFVKGGREETALDALEWAKQAEELGAGEICLNSIDADGTKNGYDKTITQLIASNVSIPVIASGGAGTKEHLVELFDDTLAQAALIASMVHYNLYSLEELKLYMHKKNINVRLDW